MQWVHSMHYAQGGERWGAQAGCTGRVRRGDMRLAVGAVGAMGCRQGAHGRVQGGAQRGPLRGDALLAQLISGFQVAVLDGHSKYCTAILGIAIVWLRCTRPAWLKFNESCSYL